MGDADSVWTRTASPCLSALSGERKGHGAEPATPMQIHALPSRVHNRENREVGEARFQTFGIAAGGEPKRCLNRQPLSS